MPGHDPADELARATALMEEALAMLDAAGATLVATHLEQALHLLREQVSTR